MLRTLKQGVTALLGGLRRRAFLLDSHTGAAPLQLAGKRHASRTTAREAREIPCCRPQLTPGIGFALGFARFLLRSPSWFVPLHPFDCR